MKKLFFGYFRKFLCTISVHDCNILVIPISDINSFYKLRAGRAGSPTRGSSPKSRVQRKNDAEKSQMRGRPSTSKRLLRAGEDAGEERRFNV